MRLRQLLLASVLLTGGCGSDIKSATIFAADKIPERLSEWGVLNTDGRHLRLNEGVVPYDLNSPLFSDYALKLRTVWMPPETSAGYRSDREFDFPVGTIICKTFHYGYTDGAAGEVIRVIKADREAELDAEDADAAIAMPELGRASNHIEGVAVVRSWINSPVGTC